jgi:hypothetical protein
MKYEFQYLKSSWWWKESSHKSIIHKMETTIKLWILVIVFYVVIKIIVIAHGQNLKLIFESAYNT